MKYPDDKINNFKFTPFKNYRNMNKKQMAKNLKFKSKNDIKSLIMQNDKKLILRDII